MANKSKRMLQNKQAMKKGLSPLQVLQMRSIADKRAKEIEDKATKAAFLAMLAIPLNVLISDYWPKAKPAKTKKYIEQVLSLYEAWEMDVVTTEQLNDFLFEYGGIKVDDIQETSNRD